MRKYIIFSLMILLSLQSFSQRRAYNQRSNRGRSEYTVGLITGGLALGIIGGTTTPDWKYSGSPNQINSNTYYPVVNKPFFQQGPQMMCIVTGATLTITGLITYLAGK
jgi:hypothetical protein